MPDVLDSSAVIALLHGEAGAGTVLTALDGALISSVNEAEILRVLVRQGLSVRDAGRAMARLRLSIVPFDSAQAVEAAEVSRLAPPLSLGGCACLALARLQPARRVLTADRAWAEYRLQVNLVVVR